MIVAPQVGYFWHCPICEVLFDASPEKFNDEQLRQEQDKHLVECKRKNKKR
jgi:hypothetical protein